MRFSFGPFVLALSMAAGAQTSLTTVPAQADVRALLESPAPRDHAWGAWWAANGAMRELEPQLRHNLETLLDAKFGAPREMALDATLDALIQLGADSLPFDLLESVFASGQAHQAQVLILMAEPSRPAARLAPVEKGSVPLLLRCATRDS